MCVGQKYCPTGEIQVILMAESSFYFCRPSGERVVSLGVHFFYSMLISQTFYLNRADSIYIVLHFAGHDMSTGGNRLCVFFFGTYHLVSLNFSGAIAHFLIKGDILSRADNTF